MADIRDKLIALGVQSRNIFTVGTARMKGSSAAKQGNSSVKPAPERCSRRDYATLVVECAISQTLWDLQMAANRWLTHTGDMGRECSVDWGKGNHPAFRARNLVLVCCFHKTSSLL